MGTKTTYHCDACKNDVDQFEDLYLVRMDYHRNTVEARYYVSEVGPLIHWDLCRQCYAELGFAALEECDGRTNEVAMELRKFPNETPESVYDEAERAAMDAAGSAIYRLVQVAIAAATDKEAP